MAAGFRIWFSCCRSSFFVLISTLRFSFKIKLLFNFFKYMYSVNVSLSFVFHISHLQFTLQPLKIAQGTNYFPKTFIFMQVNQAFFPLIPVSLFHCLTCTENPEMDTQSKYKLHLPISNTVVASSYHKVKKYL